MGLTRIETKKLKRKKKNALVICKDGKDFWTTQDQFWQWVREKVIVGVKHNPLRGRLSRRDEEYAVLINKMVLNLSCPNHLREVLYTARFKKG